MASLFDLPNPAWSFNAGRFKVTLTINEEDGYQYDGEDPDGEVQGKIDDGEYVAFESVVHVYLDGQEIGWNALGGSVYAADEVSDFFTAHRDPNFMNRNCSLRRAIHPGSSIGHYFPDMIREAIGEARDHVRAMQPAPRIREGA